MVDPFSLMFHVTASSAAAQPLPVPPVAIYQGFHVYGQWLVGGTTGAVTRAIDVNIQ